MGALVRRRGFLQGPLEVAAGRLGRTAGPGVLRGDAQGGDHPALAARRGPDQVGRDLLRHRSVLAGEQGRPPVPGAALGVGDGSSDRGPDQRVREGRRVARLHDPGPDQRVGGRRGLVGGEPGQRGHAAQRRIGLEHGDRFRDRPPGGPGPGQAQAGGALQGDRRRLLELQGGLVVRGATAAGDGLEQLVEQQRVAAGHPGAFAAERVRRLGEPPPDELGARRRGQRVEPQGAAPHLPQQAGEQVLDGGGLTGPHGDEQRDRQVGQALREVEQEGHRGPVPPLHVVDDQQPGPAPAGRGELGDQAVRRVHQLELVDAGGGRAVQHRDRGRDGPAASSARTSGATRDSVGSSSWRTRPKESVDSIGCRSTAPPRRPPAARSPRPPAGSWSCRCPRPPRGQQPPVPWRAVSSSSMTWWSSVARSTSPIMGVILPRPRRRRKAKPGETHRRAAGRTPRLTA